MDSALLRCDRAFENCQRAREACEVVAKSLLIRSYHYACRLYLVTPPVLRNPVSFAAILAATLDAGDIACVQLRLKGEDDAALLWTIEALRPIVQSRGIAFLLNDRPDLALLSGCDGVHVGQNDMSYVESRHLVGADSIVGVTCSDSRHLAMVAAEQGADYVAFGAFFPTATKHSRALAPVTLIQWWTELMTVPCVAIGGITPRNCEPLIQAGADFLAVSAGVWNHPAGPEAAVAQFSTILGAGQR